MTPTLNISPREGCIACFCRDIVPLRLDFAGPLLILPEDYPRFQRSLQDLQQDICRGISAFSAISARPSTRHLPRLFCVFCALCETFNKSSAEAFLRFLRFLRDLQQVICRGMSAISTLSARPSTRHLPRHVSVFCALCETFNKTSAEAFLRFLRSLRDLQQDICRGISAFSALSARPSTRHLPSHFLRCLRFLRDLQQVICRDISAFSALSARPSTRHLPRHFCVFCALCETLIFIVAFASVR